MASERMIKAAQAIGFTLSPVVAGGVGYFGALLAFGFQFAWSGLGGAGLMGFAAFWVISKGVQSGAS